MRERKKCLSIAMIGAFALIASGCGNYARQGGFSVSKESFQMGSQSSDPYPSENFPSDANYTCPTMPNVTPRYEVHSGDEDHYYVCPSKLNATDIAIHGAPYVNPWLDNGTLPRVCVFPVELVDQDHGYPKLGRDGRAMYDCVDYSSEGMKTGFASTRYNAVIIVPENLRESMSGCLAEANFNITQDNLYRCPAFSRGKIR